MANIDPLVFVIGAGASKEVKLPIGLELTTAIADSLNFKLDSFQRLAGGDEQLRECIYKLAQSPHHSNGTADDYYRSALRIREAMPLAPSIDNFIDSHREDKTVAQVSKIAITSCILKAERDSSLYIDRSNSHNKLDFSALRGTWFSEFFGLVCQHCSREELAARLSRLTIISFNYDRCVTQFLRQALLTYYDIPQSQADEILSNVSILHPYGSIGRMPGEAGGMGPNFGDQLTSAEIIRSAQLLKTFTESTDSTAEETKRIRASITNTKTLVFLGFAFHPMNLELLYGTDRPGESSRDCDVLGTAMGISDSNRTSVIDDLAELGGYAKSRIRLHQGLKAGALISEYSRHLARSVQGAV